MKVDLLTLDEVAEKCDRNQSVVSKWLKAKSVKMDSPLKFGGKRLFTEDQCKKLVDYSNKTERRETRQDAPSVVASNKGLTEKMATLGQRVKINEDSFSRYASGMEQLTKLFMGVKKMTEDRLGGIEKQLLECVDNSDLANRNYRHNNSYIVELEKRVANQDEQIKGLVENIDTCMSLLEEYTKLGVVNK